MGTNEKNKGIATFTDPSLYDQKYYSNMQKQHIIRMVLTYLVPLIILSVYLQFQYQTILKESRSAHLKTVAESQAKTVDLFIRERLANLFNLIDDPKLNIPPTDDDMIKLLDRLRKYSNTFVDIGFFNSSGIQIAYEGPILLWKKEIIQKSHGLTH